MSTKKHYTSIQKNTNTAFGRKRKKNLELVHLKQAVPTTPSVQPDVEKANHLLTRSQPCLEDAPILWTIRGLQTRILEVG